MIFTLWLPVLGALRRSGYVSDICFSRGDGFRTCNSPREVPANGPAKGWISALGARPPGKSTPTAGWAWGERKIRKFKKTQGGVDDFHP